uniref:RNA-directed DNA polymerase, eukaryota n=1 Tax=Tanacetum cinerariifolium TaxID=118510 RepID=A0A699IWV4_TANCI|nr:hypothetical protein [Tanacetum cinerariifolium]
MFDETPQNKGITSSLKACLGTKPKLGRGSKAKEGPRVLSTTSDIIGGFIRMTKRQMNLHGKSHNIWVMCPTCRLHTKSEAYVTVKGSYNTKYKDLNELLSWCKRKKKQALIFKVDFAKAYDSVRWDYLLVVLHAFGFGPNWCKWIRGTFSSAMASILVNGSPTSELPFFCGLKQGDPLAPFLFILIMESLHICFSRAVSDGFFKGIDIQASGLKINLLKSQVLGVGVPRNIVHQGASLVGYAVMQTPFRYLGVSVGEQMSRKSTWVNTIQELHSRLSKWKVKTLSVGGRLTLLKSVLGSSPLYNMSIYKVPKGVLHDMESIRSNFFNEADLSEKKITWVAWERVLASKKNGGLGFDFVSRCKKRVGDGCNTRFWLDTWVFDCPLSVRFPRIFALEKDKAVFVSVKLGAISIDDSFRRPIRDGVERQQWVELSSILDYLFLPSSVVATRWVKYIPIKINIFTWRARLDRLPTRYNLAKRGVVLESPLCLICGSVREDSIHILFQCELAKLVFRKIFRWWDLDSNDISSFSDWDVWFSTIRLPSKLKLILEGVFYVSLVAYLDV